MTGSESADAQPASDEGSYRGVLGAFPYAFRASESRLFKSYVVLGGLVAAVAVFLFAASAVTLLAETFRTTGGTFTFSRSFVVVVALAVVAPLLAPVLFVARSHRRGTESVVYDRALAGVGYLFLASLYLALLISAPPALRDDPTGPFAPLVSFLYGLPPLAGLVPPLVAAAVIYLVHRRYRSRNPEDG
jgi:hypothetical protein